MTASDAAPALEIEDLGKNYRLRSRGLGRLLPGKAKARSDERAVDSLWALRHVSLTVAPGEVVGVIGANGAGKSTLLKILARVTVPSEGRALVRGRVVPLLRLGAGFHAEYTGRENVYLNAALHGIPRGVVDRRIEDVFAYAELERFADQPVKTYSSGMYLRLAFAVALQMEPDVLLADEILAVGDAAFQERCMQSMAAAGGQGVTTLLVSHDMEAVRRLCPRVVRLDGGRLVDDGDAADVVGRYESEARASGGPGVRRLEGGRRRVELEGFRVLDAAGAPLEAPLTSQDLTLELRFKAVPYELEVRPGIRLSAGGAVVLETRAPDTVLSWGPARYRAAIHLPGGILAARDFEVAAVFELDKRGGKRREEVVDHAATLRLRRAPEDHAVGLAAPERGVVDLPASWALERTEELHVPDEEIAR